MSRWRKRGFLTDEGMRLMGLLGASRQELEEAFPGSNGKQLRQQQNQLAKAMFQERALMPRSPAIEEMMVRSNGQTGIEEYAEGRITINWDDGKLRTNLGKSLGDDWWNTFSEHNAIQRAYSDHYGGKGETMAEIARRFKFPTVHHVRAYLRAWGIYHSSTPQSYLELSDPDFDEDAAVEENVAARQLRLYDRVRKREWQDTVKDAESWRLLDSRVVQPMVADLREYFPSYQPPVLDLTVGDAEPHVVVTGASDLHFGKFAYGPDGKVTYNKEIARQALLDTTQELIKMSLRYGLPDRFIVPVGSDNLHVDNEFKTTTRGTPQDVDGEYELLLEPYIKSTIDYIELHRQVAPVTVIVIKGNHDKVASQWIGQLLKYFYLDVEVVDVVIRNHPRTYIQVGKYCLGFTHGDPEFTSASKRKGNVHKLVLTEAKEQGISLDEVEHTYYFAGNLHYELNVDFGAVTYVQFPALCGDDRWHKENVFVGSRNMSMAVTVDLERGVVNKWYAPVQRSTS